MVAAAEVAALDRPAGPDRAAAADGMANNAVAERVGVNQATVVKWRKGSWPAVWTG